VVDLSVGSAEPARWHLDKKVQLPFILTVVSAIGSGIWWTSAASGRIASLEKSDALTSSRMDEAANTRVVIRERLSAIEEATRNTQDMLRRMDAKLDRIRERP
jgi:hypothetical protein